MQLSGHLTHIVHLALCFLFPSLFRAFLRLFLAMAEAGTSAKADSVKDVPPKAKAASQPAQNPVFKMMGKLPCPLQMTPLTAL